MLRVKKIVADIYGLIEHILFLVSGLACRV
jgi:hypothetical protein